MCFNLTLFFLNQWWLQITNTHDKQKANTVWNQGFWCSSAKAQKWGKFSFMSTKMPMQYLFFVTSKLLQTNNPFQALLGAKSNPGCFLDPLKSSDCFSSTMPSVSTLPPSAQTRIKQMFLSLQPGWKYPAVFWCGDCSFLSATTF